MSDVFILQNHDQLYLDKHGEWTDGGDASGLYRTTHKDEAVNHRLELTVRHPELRINVVHCALDAKGRPQLPDAATPAGSDMPAERSSLSETS